jgi:hypothetical protein
MSSFAFWTQAIEPEGKLAKDFRKCKAIADERKPPLIFAL